MLIEIFLVGFALMRWLFVFLIVVAVALVAFVRLSPVDVDVWHVAGDARDPGSYPETGGFTIAREITTTPERILLVLDDIALNTPRTRLLAGNIADGILTYETRSRIMGFPDYTTAQIVTSPDGRGPMLQIYGRLRFGRSDLGVNEARIEGWLAQLGLLTVKP